VTRAANVSTLVSRSRLLLGDALVAAPGRAYGLLDGGPWSVDLDEASGWQAAGDTVEANLNPVGRLYYGFSTFLCVPNAIRQGVTDAGFTRFRRVAETPFNLVFEARP
jgi:hypothetical protein